MYFSSDNQSYTLSNDYVLNDVASFSHDYVLNDDEDFLKRLCPERCCLILTRLCPERQTTEYTLLKIRANTYFKKMK